MNKAKADFGRFQAAVTRERLPDRVPNAEGGVDIEVMEDFLGQPIRDIKTYALFWEKAGYDYVLLQVRGQPIHDSTQIKIAEGVLTARMPTTVSTDGACGIQDKKTFDEYSWIGPEDVYYKDVDMMKDYLPDSMKLIVNHGPLFQSLFRIMGIETLSTAMVENPELVRATAEKVGELSVNIVESLLQREWVGGIWYGDDLAYTRGLLVSPNFLREYVFPYYKRMGNLCKRYQKLFLLHSDGKLLEIMDDLIQCGFQAVHPNEPLSVDIAELKRAWGHRLAFLGNIDVDLLARGTPDQIVKAARNLIDTVAPGGGFALGSGNSVTRYVPLENYKAMLEAVHKYGRIY
ncbi:MAG: hypothetical protein L6437_09645 [Kiritimatiellae bacterium]|nr:hypothetical protein [Kiritimatiellia bacterium]